MHKLGLEDRWNVVWTWSESMFRIKQSFGDNWYTEKDSFWLCIDSLQQGG